jgi:CRP-like cAMP-binding protein
MNNELSVAQRLDVLASCPVFHGAPHGDLRLLAEMALTVRLSKDQTLFEAGEHADGIYVIASGRLGVMTPGRSEIVRELGPGDLLGEYGMVVDAAVRTATVRTVKATELFFVDYPRFRAFLIQCPQSLFILFQTAARRLTELEKIFTDRS